MKPQKIDVLFDEALEIIKRNAHKDPMNAFSWIDLLEGNLEEYSDFDKWCLERYSVSANEYLLNNGIINNKNDISNDTNAINIENAILAYQNAIQTIYDKGKRTYNDYIVGDAKIVGEAEKEYQYNGESILTAHDFFTRLDNNEDQEAKEEYAKECNGLFKDLLDNKDFYWIMEGILEPEVSIAVAIAYVLFIDPKAAVYLEFLRSKWEYRGDYGTPHTGDKWLYFYYSSEAPNGEVGWKYWKSPLKYEWEIEKEEEKRKTECQQMISLNTYDEVESLDLNNTKILFLVDYSDDSIRLRHEEEYCYVAGSMVCLFNYACSYVGSIEAKPDYIIVDQNSVKREDLQAAIIYRKLNPNVIMLELSQFVDLLDKTDLKGFKKNKPAVTKGELEDDAFGAPLDKPKEESLKEYSEFTFFTDLELIKAAKHISIPKDCIIKDKIFVFTCSGQKVEDKVIKAGGIIKKSVSGKTDYLVIDLQNRVSGRFCEQANTLFDKGKGDKLHIITPRILNKMLKG